MATLILNTIGHLAGIKSQPRIVEFVYFYELDKTYMVDSLVHDKGIAWSAPDGLTVFETFQYEIFTAVV